MLGGRQTYSVWVMLCSVEKRAMEEQRENETAAIDSASILPLFFCLFCFQHSVSLSSALSVHPNTPTPHPRLSLLSSLMLCFPSFPQYRSSLWGKAGSRVVMSCQQCSDGSLTYFWKYHRFLFLALLSSVPFKHIPDGWHKEH